MNDPTNPMCHPPGIKVDAMDWRLSGFVAVDPAQFPDGDPVGHRAVKWYDDEVVTRVRGDMAANLMRIRPACTDPDPEARYVEMTPLYAESRGAVWCRECFPEAS